MRDIFRKYVLKNLGLKILALLLALLMWSIVGHDPNAEIALKVPIEFHNAPDNLVMTSDIPLEAQITVSGPERIVRQLSPAELHAVIDLQDASAGQRTFDLVSQHIHVPRDLQVVQVVPSQFHIAFDHSASRVVPVRPRVIGTFAAGYSIQSVQASPAQVTIVGPEKRVNAVDAALTDPVDASGVVGSATFVSHAYVADPLVQLQHPEPIHVTITTGKTSEASAPQPDKHAGT